MVTVTFLDEEPVSEESPVEILLQHFSEDGSVEELELEGDLADARSLVLKLSSEGSCVEVEIAQPDEEGEGEEEAPEAGEEEEADTGEEVVEPAELPEPASP